MEAVLQLKDITRTYKTGAEELHVLNGINLTLQKGELVALVGPSGAGKSTLLHTAGLLEQAQGGQVLINGHDATHLKDNARTALRSKAIGFVYQFHHLLPEFSARENIMLPQMLAGISKARASRRADELLELVGLTPRRYHRPAQLSGGEQQRVAITRALANNPSLLLADEPTGNLDAHTSDTVFHFFMELARNQNLSALIATHNLDLARQMDRIVEMRDGVLVES